MTNDAGEAAGDPVPIQDLMHTYGLSEQMLTEFRAVGRTLLPRLDEMVSDFYAWLATRAEFRLFFQDPAVLARVQALQRAYWGQFLQANVDAAYVQSRRRVGEVHARIDLPMDIYFSSMTYIQGWLSSRIVQAGYPPHRTEQMLSALTRLSQFDTGLIVATFHERWKEILASRRARWTDADGAPPAQGPG